MTTFGYGRVSRDSQTSENQKQLIEAQLRMPLDFWYEDHATSGTVKAADRPQFAEMMKHAGKGDTIIFSRVDRISRKTSDVLNTVEALIERGVEVYILQIGREPLNSPMGKVILGVFAIFAENERLSMVERTKAGLERTKKSGTVLGRSLKIPPDTLVALCKGRDDGMTLDSLSTIHKIDRNTICQNVKKHKDSLEVYRVEYNKRAMQYKAAEATRMTT